MSRVSLTIRRGAVPSAGIGGLLNRAPPVPLAAADEPRDETTPAGADAAEEEVDELDAFMAEVNQEIAAQQQQQSQHGRVAKRPRLSDDASAVESTPGGADIMGGRADFDAEEEEDGDSGAAGKASGRDFDSGGGDVLPRVDHATAGYAPFTRCCYDVAAAAAHVDADDGRTGSNATSSHATLGPTLANAVASRRRAFGVHVECGGAGAPRFDLATASATSAAVPHPSFVGPVESFLHLQLDPVPALLAAVASAGYEAPTPVQSQALPLLLTGHDVIGIAATGSGKTLAYTLPLVRHCALQPPLGRHDGPLALVLTPTRELAEQVHAEVKRFGRALGLVCALVTGGGSKYDQSQALQAGAHVIVATPGRLIDQLRAGTTNLHRVTFLCIDEADRMFDMGFSRQLYALLNSIRPDRQTVLFSATFPRKVEALAAAAASQPLRDAPLAGSAGIIGGRVSAASSCSPYGCVKVIVGSVGAAAADVRQDAVVLPSAEAKWPWLQAALPQMLAPPLAGSGADGELPKVLIFVSSKAAAEDLASKINGDLRLRRAILGGSALSAPSPLHATAAAFGAPAAVDPICYALHGDRHQSERRSIVAAFKRAGTVGGSATSSAPPGGGVRVLVATDIASRGLDIKGVSTVVNFDAARDVDTHVHRVGRTGRIGAEGIPVPGNAVTLLDAGKDLYAACDLVRNLLKSGHPIPRPLLDFAHRNPAFKLPAPTAARHGGSNSLPGSFGAAQQSSMLPAGAGLGFGAGGAGPRPAAAAPAPLTSRFSAATASAAPLPAQVASPHVMPARQLPSAPSAAAAGDAVSDELDSFLAEIAAMPVRSSAPEPLVPLLQPPAAQAPLPVAPPAGPVLPSSSVADLPIAASASIVPPPKPSRFGPPVTSLSTDLPAASTAAASSSDAASAADCGSAVSGVKRSRWGADAVAPAATTALMPSNAHAAATASGIGLPSAGVVTDVAAAAAAAAAAIAAKFGMQQVAAKRSLYQPGVRY